MTKEREALKLALSTLDEVRSETFRLLRNGQKLYAEEKVWNTIIAIKEALAQPEQPVQEPECSECKAKLLYECVACSNNNYPPQRQPLTHDEINKCDMCGYVGKDKDSIGQCPKCRWDELRPLVEKARQKPLTDDQIYDMYNEPRSDAEMLEFARAIEAAHGIKGQQ